MYGLSGVLTGIQCGIVSKLIERYECEPRHSRRWWSDSITTIPSRGTPNSWLSLSICDDGTPQPHVLIQCS